MFSIVLTGFTIGLGLIVAIGAQNAWVLGVSIRKQYAFTVACVCFTIDALLMAIGVQFVQVLKAVLPGIVPWMTYLGVAMLLWLAFGAAKRAWRGEAGLEASSNESKVSRKRMIATAAAISLLNPHVYLDTVILVGGLAAVSEAPWLFWLGAASASVLWFSTLAVIGKPLSKWLVSPIRWRIFDSGMAVVLTVVAWNLFHLA